MAKNLKTLKSFRFTDQEVARMDRLKGDGSYAELLMRGLDALERDSGEAALPSKADVIAWVRAQKGA